MRRSFRPYLFGAVVFAVLATGLAMNESVAVFISSSSGWPLQPSCG